MTYYLGALADILKKLRLFILINNNEIAVSSARKLVQRLELPHFQLLGTVFDDLKSQRINSAICGLLGTEFPLWKLGELLDETWVGEDILNGLAELLYFQQAAKNPYPNPTFLYLQTSFFTDARLLYERHPRLYSHELLDLRQRLLNTDVLKIGIQVCDDNHYSSYVTSVNSDKFDHGDSMHNPPLADALQIFQWVFTDIPGFKPERIDSNTCWVARQGNGNGGDGSCGIATFNFTERCLYPDTPSWSGPHSQLFRDRALRDLVLYHVNANEIGGCVTDLVSRCIPTTEHKIPNAEFCGYNDYNLYSPKVCNPCYYEY